jgi:beta-mannosidase
MEYIYNYRRRWPSTGSAIYWMFNDSWPTVHGWGTFDYFLKRKLSFHPVRRAFANVAVALVDEGEEVGVFVVNDVSCTQSLTLETGSFLASGPAQLEGAWEGEVPAFTSLRVKALARDPQRVHYAVLRDRQGRVVAQNRLLLKPFGEWAMGQPAIRVDPVEREDGRYARYASHDWVWNVVLDPTGEEPALDDVFDLLPGIPYEVKLTPGQPVLPVAFTGNQLVNYSK